MVLPAGHPLSRRSEVRLADVSALATCPCRAGPPDGSYPDGPGPQVRDHAQLLQLIALGRAWRSCRSRSAGPLRDDLAAVPVLDAPTVTTVIAWPPHSRSRALAGLVRTATRL